VDERVTENHYLWTNHKPVTTRCGATVRLDADNCNPRHAIETCNLRRVTSPPHNRTSGGEPRAPDLGQ
jgi:hypothetical protein